MALITKQVKVSNRAESYLADKLNVDKALFKRLKYVNPNVMRFTFFILQDSEIIGTVNYFWDFRKINHIIYLRRFSDKKITKVKHLNQRGVSDFFGE